MKTRDITWYLKKFYVFILQASGRFSVASLRSLRGYGKTKTNMLVVTAVRRRRSPFSRRQSGKEHALLRFVFFSMRSDSHWTAKRSHRVAGGRARFLRAAPGRHPTSIRTLKGCNRNIREFQPRRYLTARTLVCYRLFALFLQQSICAFPIAPFQGASCWGSKTGGGAQNTRSAPGYSM